MHWRRPLALLPVLLLSACLETDLTLKADGTVTGTISWTSVSKLPEKGARALLAAEGVTVKSIELKDAEVAGPKGGKPAPGQRVTAVVESKSVSALTRMAVFSSLGVTAATTTPEKGKHALTVQAAKNERLGRIPDTESVIRLHVPGPVLETSATAKGDEVTWKVPAAEFKTKPSVELKVTYGDAPPAADQDAAPPPAADEKP